MEQDTTIPTALTTGPRDILTEILHYGAQRMVGRAIENEVAEYLAAHREQLDQHGHRLVALDDGRLFPRKSDYESINFTEKKFFVSKDEIPQNAKKHQIPSIHVNLHNTLCKIKGCPRSKKAYLRYSALIRHYKMKHPGIKIIYGDSS